jgi:tetratricopeptide (TPR) repeat protein
MPSSLEIYAEAFELQNKGNFKEAEERYHQLIKEHPQSKEADYAQVQLETFFQRHEPREVSDRTEVAKKGSIGVLGMIGFILSCLALILSLVLLFLFLNQDKELKYQRTILKAAIAFNAGNINAFHRYINNAKKFDPSGKEAYLLTADFYMKKGDINNAIKVLRACPIFDADIRLYYDRIKKLTTGKQGPSQAKSE